jgi:hypothetical protein
MDEKDPLSLNLYAYVKNNPLIYVDPEGQFWSEIWGGTKYVGKRGMALVHGAGEFAWDTVTGIVGLTYSVVETGAAEVGIVGNYVGNKVGLIGLEQYDTNTDNLMSTVTKNGEMYWNLPGNIVNGTIDNFTTTFNWNNFKKYWNPNTSYTELKNYSKSAIQTGVTIYGGVKAVKGLVNGVKNGIKSATKITNKIDDLSSDIKGWLGNNAKVITNNNGDKIFISNDGIRRIRFDIKNTLPHNNPHGHIEILENGKWIKSGPLYPINVPHN